MIGSSMAITRARVSALAVMFSAAALFADIKIGSNSWSLKYTPGAITGIPAANQYGGGYCHLDLSWTWTLEQGFSMVNTDWSRAADCLDDNPTWYAGHDGSWQAANWIVKTQYPTTFTRIKQHSDAGRYDAGALAWSEGYWSFGGDEYYLRNYYISSRFCQDNFGYAPVLAAGFDIDAPAWTQPKMQAYMVGKSTENPTALSLYQHATGAGGTYDPGLFTGASWNSYKWTSDDGSTVIVGNGGNWGGDAGGCESCGHSAGPSRTFLKKVLQENVWDTISRVQNSQLSIIGSGYSLMWYGTKICENRLLDAEKFATFARPLGYTYPLHGDAYLYDVWGRLMMFNQHDVADAQGTPWQTIVSNPTNTNLQDAIAHALNVADSTLRGALTSISSNVNTSGSGASVIVYNPLSWARTEYVMIAITDLGLTGALDVKDPAGTALPCQVIDDGGIAKLAFVAESVPSLGLKEYKVSAGASTVAALVSGATQASQFVLDNQFLTVKIDRTTGAITSILDKANSQELLASPGSRLASTTNTPSWWDDCCGFYSHATGEMPAALTYKTPSSVVMTDSGPAVARVKIVYAENGVNWRHDIALFGKDQVVRNFMSTTNLTNNNELVLNVSLAPAVGNSKKEQDAGVAYGHHQYTGATSTTYTQKWADVSNDGKTYGVALLENNCSIWSYYGIGGARDFRMPIIAEQTSRYSGHWSMANWKMSWGIWGHTGDWTNGAVQKGYEFNSPLIGRVETSHVGSLPKEYSFLTVEPENIVVTAVKKWEGESPTRNDSLTMQVRFFEIDGINTDAVLKFPSSRSIAAWESRGDEYGVYGNQLPVTTDAGMQKVTFATGHNQIRSLKVQTPYGGTSVYGALTSTVRIADQGQASRVRVCNVKGQVLWQGASAGLRAAQTKFISANGIYFIQYLSEQGVPLMTQKVQRLAQPVRAR